MYISPRAALVRNFSVSLFNGIITLVILLITIVTYIVTTVGDRVVTFLQSNDQPAELLSN